MTQQCTFLKKKSRARIYFVSAILLSIVISVSCFPLRLTSFHVPCCLAHSMPSFLASSTTLLQESLLRFLFACSSALCQQRYVLGKLSSFFDISKCLYFAFSLERKFAQVYNKNVAFQDFKYIIVFSILFVSEEESAVNRSLFISHSTFSLQ